MQISTINRAVPTRLGRAKGELKASPDNTSATEQFDTVSLSSLSRTGWSAATDLLTKMTQESEPTKLLDLVQAVESEQTSDGGWKQTESASRSDTDTSVLNHVALATYLRRAEHAKSYRKAYSKAHRAQYTPDAQVAKKLEASLAKSWKNLTGTVPQEHSALLGALPQGGVLHSVSQGPAAIHEALLGKSLEVRIEPDKAIEQALQQVECGLDGAELESQPPKSTSLKMLAGVAALATAGGAAVLAASAGVIGAAGLMAAAAPLAPVLAGAAVGWAVASYNESMVHDEVLHVQDLPNMGKILHEDKPKSLVAKIYEKSPKFVQKSIFDAWFGHTKIHHYRTFRQDHVTQFKSAEEQSRLDGYLLKEGQEHLLDEEHGMTIGMKGYMRFQAVATPAYTVALGAAAAVGVGALGAAATLAAAPLFALGFAAPTAIYPLFSKDYHRFTHMPAKQALKTASLPMRAYLKTDMSRYTLRHHFVHHEDEHVNFNLMLGGDWMRGTAQQPTVAQEEEMRRLKVLW